MALQRKRSFHGTIAGHQAVGGIAPGHRAVKFSLFDKKLRVDYFYSNLFPLNLEAHEEKFGGFSNTNGFLPRRRSPRAHSLSRVVSLSSSVAYMSEFSDTRGSMR